MTNRFLISVAAAALIAASGFANAQGPGGGGSSGGAGMSQGGSAGGGAAGGGAAGGGASERGNAPSQMNRDSAPSGAAKGAQSDRMEGGKNAQSDRMEGTKSKSAQDDMKGQKSQQNTASDTDRKGGKDMKTEGRESKDKVGDSRDQNRMGKDGDRTNNAQTQGRDSDRMNADSKSGSQTTTTTGQAGAGAKLSTEQRTKITTVIKSQNVAPVTNVNFNISIGTRVPRDVTFHVLPAEVVTIYPQWRGYKFVMVREEIVIVDPNTYEIVEIIRV